MRRHQIAHRLTSCIVALLLVLAAGTASFHYVEGLRLLDAFYLTGLTVTTVGYGDITPHTDLGRILSVLFALSGISIVLYSATMLGALYFSYQDKYLMRNHKVIRRKMRKMIR